MMWFFSSYFLYVIEFYVLFSVYNQMITTVDAVSEYGVNPVLCLCPGPLGQVAPVLRSRNVSYGYL